MALQRDPAAAMSLSPSRERIIPIACLHPGEAEVRARCEG